MTTTSEPVRQRSSILGTQVISKATARRLGVVSQLWLDMDQRQVVAVSVRDNLIAGTPQYMSLSSIALLGPDAILVDNEDVFEDINVDAYTSLIGSEVVTETGELLGKVRDFKFDPGNGEIFQLILSSLGIPLIPSQVVSTYELDVNEIIAVGRDRIIVTEGMEERLTQLTVGILERLGIGKPPWERDEDYISTVDPNDMLGTGSSRPSTARTVTTRASEDMWDDDNWSKSRPAARRKAPEPYYDEELEEADNWSDEAEEYEEPYEEDNRYRRDNEDAWSDEEPYEAPRVNIPQKQRQPEYEEEKDY
ncbi:PRC-barrel domain-containing protein [Leptolyngbya sp. FACHB-261]|uniref:PRC-barrel domain-containing protein n=1 Tax=Leptolyngbya sp. FACHB-261 TaxID=2692806 RepID=UPI001684F66E|nr:PRC-barrel domain-containing protein [Leptolyngbya sp. FACHB-261]MBD2099704.1 PRC-barrel domain-containing protein [Leptolyngbya sp. FACHB-261]